MKRTGTWAARFPQPASGDHLIEDRRGTDLPEPLRRGLRARAIRAAVLGIAGLAVAAGVLAMILIAQLLGSQAWRAGDPVAAGQHFAVNQQLNLMQRWIAPFNQGVARHGRGEFLVAAGLYEEALASAPEAMQCRVVLNWSWALEAAGDQAARTGHPQIAGEQWAAAKEVLSRADSCDDGSSGLLPDDVELSSSSPSPTQAAPLTPTPSVQPTAPGDDDAEVPSDSDASQPQPGSEQDQVDQTKQRIEQKVAVPGDSATDPPDQPGPGKSELLDERNHQGAEQRQRRQDEERRTADDAPVRSW